MKLVEWIKAVVNGKNPNEIPDIPDAGFLYPADAEYQIRELMIWNAINIVANAVAKCEFKTLLNGEETRAEEYFLWNYSPNINQSSGEFIKSLITRLYMENEALVIEFNNQLLIADSFVKDEYAIKEDIFKDVTVKNFKFRENFTQSEVLYFKLSEEPMKEVIYKLHESYGSLIHSSIKNYKKARGSRGILKIDSSASGNPKFQAHLNDLMNNKFKKFYEAENAVLPLTTGFDYSEDKAKTYSSESTRDIRALADDIGDFTAKAFGIPPALLRGDIAGTTDALDNFLTFCIDPLCKMLSREINRKRNKLKGLKEGTQLIIDTKAIKHVDLLSVATSIDKLISSGAFSPNDIRKLCGEQAIKEEWADKHYITKNYTEVDPEDVEGGE